MSKQLDAHPTGGGRSEAGVTSHQGGAQFCGECNVSGIVGRQIMPQPPDMWQEEKVGIARQAEVEQILERLIGALGGNRGFPHQSPQDLRHLNVEKVRSVKGFAARVNPDLHSLARGGLKKPVDHG